MKKSVKSNEKKESGAKQLSNYELPKDFSAKPMKRRKLNRKNTKLALILLIIALLALVFILLVQFGFVNNPFEKLNREPELFRVEDSCSLIVGQLIHTINNADECEVRCKANCELRESDFHNSEFSQREKDCNLCNCYCK